MSKYIVIALTLSAATLAVFIWSGPSDIKHYTAQELAELSCEALGERHRELIDAYHDAEIAHYRRTGAFHDDLGIPSDDVVPIHVLMKRFMRDNNISEADIMEGSSLRRIERTDFYYEIGRICVSNPSWQSIDAMRQAAENLGLIDG